MGPFRAAGLVALSWAVAAGCAADPGDPLKVDAGTTTAFGSDDTGPPIDDGLDGAAYSSSSSGGGSGTTSGGSSSAGPGDDGSNDDASSGSASGGAELDATLDVTIGPGCGDGGEAVLVLSPAAGSYTANTGNFMTTGPVCVELQGSVHQGWCVANGQGRTLTLTSASGVQGPVDASAGCFPGLPAAPQAGSDGFVYWNFTAGDNNYTSLYIY